jgi:hypothetical protein
MTEIKTQYSSSIPPNSAPEAKITHINKAHRAMEAFQNSWSNRNPGAIKILKVWGNQKTRKSTSPPTLLKCSNIVAS